MTGIDPATTEFVVIRPEGGIEFSELSDSYEGEWRKRADLVDQSVIETLGPAGLVRAYPTDRVEQSPAGDLAQVYEVAEGDSDEDDDPDV